MTERAEQVARHYQRAGLLDSIDAGLRSAGLDPERTRLEDLAAVDHFHLRGLEATHELARLAGVSAGMDGPPHFPVPWAPGAEISFLLSPAELRSTIAAAGFRETEWRDVTAGATEWLRARFGGGPPPAGGPALTPQVILGDGFRPAFENLLRNLEEHRVRVVEAVFQRDG